ncbi:hypothetical protein F01_421033 [Burkholderia cenocepacia]|nr:hypothetical protein F01_421033 [Burkholderia cenocepacia]
MACREAQSVSEPKSQSKSKLSIKVSSPYSNQTLHNGAEDHEEEADFGARRRDVHGCGCADRRRRPRGQFRRPR